MTDFQRVSALLAAQTWTFAKTMPHIRQHGYTGQFEGRTYTYLDVDGHFYWTMGAPINTKDGKPLTIIINRKPLSAKQ